MNFSQRIGLEPATKALQKNSMDWDLRNSLWNVFELLILSPIKRGWGLSPRSRDGHSGTLLVNLWVHFFKWPLDSLYDDPSFAFRTVREWYFNEKVPWNRIYDFVQFVAELGDDLRAWAVTFQSACNRVLEREFSAYRFVNGTLTPITSEAEIKAIEKAASLDTSLMRP